MSNDDWTPEEEQRLRAARVDRAPPPALENAILGTLRDRGLVRPPRRRLAAVVGLVAAAAALAVAAGWSVTHRPAAPPPAVPGSPRFVLLLYSGTDPMAGAPDTRREEYAQWARGVAAGGASISGEELSDDPRDVAGTPDATAASVPLPRGFFIVSAPTLEAAQHIAATCPHLRYGGRIVVKRVAGG